MNIGEVSFCRKKDKRNVSINFVQFESKIVNIEITCKLLYNKFTVDSS